MAQTFARKPSKTLRGTWDQILALSDEISKTSEMELRIFDPTPPQYGPTAATTVIKSRGQEDSAPLADPLAADSIALLESWIAEAPTDPDEIRAVEEELSEFKRNMNLPRKQAGARLLYPEVKGA